MNALTITLNGEPADLSSPATLADLLGGPLAGRETRGLAVAVNGLVVPRHRYGVHPLASGDVVEVVTAVQGG